VTRRTFLGGLTAVLASSCRAGAQPFPRLILLVTLDTLRRRNLQAYGYARPTTPHLAAIGERGFRFTNAYTQANETTTSHSVMLSGLYSHINLSYRNLQRWALPDGHATLAQMMAANGFRTAGVTSFGALKREIIGDGFAHFSAPAGSEQRAAVTNEIAFEQLGSLTRRQRAFVWLHYFDAHEPYDPPPDYSPPFTGRGYSRRGLYEYDCEISYLDHHLGQLVAFLRKHKLHDETAMIITSDHGEHFGETAGLPLEAHYGLYDYLLEAPLFLGGGWVERWRAARQLPGVCDQLVSSGITVMPTVLEWAGIRSAQFLSGYSLLPVLDRRQASPGAHLAESDSQMQVSVRTGRHKLIALNSRQFESDLERLVRKDPNVYVTARILEPIRHHMTRDGLELYDTVNDPEERTNLADRERGVVERHVRLLALMRGAHAVQKDPLPPESDRLDILRSLGYIK
jgi:arylsulfatase A-like enzyme